MTQKQKDLDTLKKWMWAERKEVIDAILLHTCEVRDRTAAMLRLVGWDVDDFVLMALRGDDDSLS